MTSDELKTALFSRQKVMVIVDDDVAITGVVTGVRYSVAYGNLIVSAEVTSRNTLYVCRADSVTAFNETI